MAAVGSPNPRGFGLFCVTLQRLRFLLLFLLGTLANKLNVPQVLLPFGREPGRVPFLLEAQRGCYTWWGVARSQEYAHPRRPGRIGGVHWTEDATGILCGHSSWRALPVGIRGGVSAGMEGQPFWYGLSLLCGMSSAYVWVLLWAVNVWDWLSHGMLGGVVTMWTAVRV